MCSSAQSQSGWEGNNTKRKTGSGLCFPSFTPPPRPPCPFLTVIALCAFSSLTRIVLSVEVKVVLTYLCCISNKPQHSPRVYYRSTIKYMFLSFSYFPIFFCDWCWTVCGSCAQPLTGNPACFFPLSLFFPRRDLGPDAKSTTDLNSAPPLDPPLGPDGPLVFTQGVVPGTAPKRSTFNVIW